MNCRESRTRLQGRLDHSTLLIEIEVKEHLVHCSECRKLHYGAERLLAGLSSIAQPQTPSGLTNRVVTAVLEDRQRRRKRQRLRYHVTIAMAASILLMALGYYWLPMPHGKQVVVTRNKPGREVAKPLGDTLKDAENAVAGLSGRLADQSFDGANLLLPPASVHLMPTGKQPMLISDSAHMVHQATMNVSQEAEPIAQSARQAFDYFLRELPLTQRRVMN